jgi:hypothetical protein
MLPRRRVSLQMFKRGNHVCSLSINISQTLLESGHFFGGDIVFRHASPQRHTTVVRLSVARITKKSQPRNARREISASSFGESERENVSVVN